MDRLGDNVVSQCQKVGPCCRVLRSRAHRILSHPEAIMHLHNTAASFRELQGSFRKPGPCSCCVSSLALLRMPSVSLRPSGSADGIPVLAPASVSEAGIGWNSVRVSTEDLKVLLEQGHSFPSIKAHFPGVELTFGRTYRNTECVHLQASLRLPDLPSGSPSVPSPPVVPSSSL